MRSHWAETEAISFWSKWVAFKNPIKSLSKMIRSFSHRLKLMRTVELILVQPLIPRVQKRLFFRSTSGRNRKSIHQVQGWIQTFYPSPFGACRTKRIKMNQSSEKSSRFIENSDFGAILSRNRKSRIFRRVTNLVKITNRIQDFDAPLIRKNRTFR